MVSRSFRSNKLNPNCYQTLWDRTYYMLGWVEGGGVMSIVLGLAGKQRVQRLSIFFHQAWRPPGIQMRSLPSPSVIYWLSVVWSSWLMWVRSRNDEWLCVAAALMCVSEKKLLLEELFLTFISGSFQYHFTIPYTIHYQRFTKRALEVGFACIWMGTRSATCIIMEFEDISDRNEW